MLAALFPAVLLFACLTPASQDERDEDTRPDNPPQILLATSIDDDGNLELVSYQTIYIGFSGESYNARSTRKISLAGVQIFDLDDNRISIDAARLRFGMGESPILATSWGRKVAQKYRPLFKSETMIFMFPKDSPEWKAIEEPGAPARK